MLKATFAALSAALMLTLAACGGSSGETSAAVRSDSVQPPTGADPVAYCEVWGDWQALPPNVENISVDDFRSVGRRLVEVGSPKGVTGDGRAGFEWLANKLPDVESGEDIGDLTRGTKVEDQIDAFNAQSQTVCAASDDAQQDRLDAQAEASANAPDEVRSTLDYKASFLSSVLDKSQFESHQLVSMHDLTVVLDEGYELRDVQQDAHYRGNYAFCLVHVASGAWSAVASDGSKRVVGADGYPADQASVTSGDSGADCTLPTL